MANDEGSVCEQGLALAVSCRVAQKDAASYAHALVELRRSYLVCTLKFL